MTETLIERRTWPSAAERSKSAVHRVRRYFVESGRHARCSRIWQQSDISKQPVMVTAMWAATRLKPVKAHLGSTSPEYVTTVRKLIELLELPGGWNSYSAKPISKENVTFAVELLGRVMRAGTPAPHVIPRVRGGVQLEWHTRGIDVEIAITSPQSVSFYAEDRCNQQEPIEQANLSERVLSQWIGRLSQ